MKKKSPFPKEVYERNARVYAMLANPKRLEILNILHGGETIVDDLSKIMDIRKANVSQHLSVLRHLRLVKFRQSAQNRYYALTDPRLVTVCQVLKDLWKKKEEK